MTYFNPTPTTAEELKKAYRKLAMIHHPDCPTGSTETMQAINNEYTALFEKLKNVHRNKDGETYTSNTSTNEMPSDFIDLISQLVKMDGVKIEICGNWIWLSENTKPYKDDIKRLGFSWSSNKKAWYKKPPEYKRRSRKNYSMDEIRNMYGSLEVETTPHKQSQPRQPHQQLTLATA